MLDIAMKTKTNMECNNPECGKETAYLAQNIARPVWKRMHRLQIDIKKHFVADVKAAASMYLALRINIRSIQKKTMRTAATPVLDHAHV